MNLHRLRWIGVVVPTGLAAVILVLVSALVPGWDHSPPELAVAMAVVAVGSYGFSTFVFHLMAASERRILDKSAQLQALNEAAVSIVGELSPAVVLQNVADRGRSLVGARYCALQTFGPAEQHQFFLTSGMAQADMDRMDHPPTGRKGLLAVVRRTARPLRVPEIGQHPASCGFPPNHPPMHSFLGVPIISKGIVVGTLYLTEKEDATEFTPEDEEVATLLANQAAVAIDNARLYQETRRNREYLERIIEGSQDALVTMTIDGRVHLWNAGAAQLYGFAKDEADGAVLPMIPEEDRDRVFQLLHQVGAGQMVPNLEAHHQRKDGSRLPVLASLSVVPNAFGEAPGVLLIARDITNQRRLETQRRRLALLEERERIGMDLHDGAIQALYAVGLNLEATRRVLPATAGDVRERLTQAAGQLNQVIQDLRGYILDQRPRGLAARTLTEGLEELAQRAREANLQVSLEVEATAAAPLPAEVAAQLIHIAGEAVSNVLRHAGASRCDIRLNTDGRGDIRLAVADDGRGFAPAAAIADGHLGLRNIRTRTQLLGGECTIASTPGQGTEVTVLIPSEGGD